MLDFDVVRIKAGLSRVSPEHADNQIICDLTAAVAEIERLQAEMENSKRACKALSAEVEWWRKQHPGEGRIELIE